ncbi:MAG: HNH endonuclease [Actinomycetota bacterium]
MLAGMFERVEATDCSRLTRTQLETLLDDVATLESFLAARRLDVMGAIDGLRDGGLPSATVLRSKGKVSERVATQAARTAEALTKMPKTAERLRTGQITEAHAVANAAAAQKADDPAKADAELNRSPIVPPADLHAKRARQWGAENERREQTERRHARQRRNRRAVFGVSDDDGSWSLYATSDTLEGKELTGLIEAEADRLFRAEDGGRGGDSDRTSAQRTLDALATLIRRGAGVESVEPGASAHPRFRPLVRVSIGDHLDDVDGELVGGGPLHRSVVDRVLRSVGLDVLITTDDGAPLWLGRTRREASPAQWTALIARDEGCVVCGADPSRCEAHHVVWWRRGGGTDIDNLVLLCTQHHHDVHDRGLDLRRRDGTWLLEPAATHERQPAAPRRVTSHHERNRPGRPDARGTPSLAS